MESISVVIVSYYTGPILFKSISSVLSQEEISQVIVVDNGNPVSDLDALKREFGSNERFQLISGHGNIGFSRACNLGVTRVTSARLLLLNPDCISPDNGVKRLSQIADAFTGKWLITPHIVTPNHIEQKGSRREILTPWITFVEGTMLYKILPRHPYFKRFDQHEQPLPTEVVDVPVTTGACMLIKTSAYRDLGGMDEGYFLHVEDIDFCMRFRKAGGRIRFCPHVTFVHAMATSQVSRLFVEWHKLKGFKRYFRLHFSRIYPPGFICLVNCLIAVRFGLFGIRELLNKIVKPLSNPKNKVLYNKQAEYVSYSIEKSQTEKDVVLSPMPPRHSSGHGSSPDSLV